jgi:hypothetical protein
MGRLTRTATGVRGAVHSLARASPRKTKKMLRKTKKITEKLRKLQKN